jgi:hypothetical protein
MGTQKRAPCPPRTIPKLPGERHHLDFAIQLRQFTNSSGVSSTAKEQPVGRGPPPA